VNHHWTQDYSQQTCQPTSIIGTDSPLTFCMLPDLQEGLGGKLHVFMSSLPKLGLHGLTPRQAAPATDNQQKQMVLLPAHKGYQQMAEDAAEHQVQQQLVHTLYRLHLAAFLSAFSCAAGPPKPECLFHTSARRLLPHLFVGNATVASKH